jgi:uncharacterized protein (TIGR02271 family)
MNMLRVLWGAIAGGAIGAFAGIWLPGIGAGIAAAVGAAVGAGLGAASGAAAFRRSSVPAASDAENVTLELREERLDVRKERVVTGDVAIRREVVEDKRTIEVPIRREEVVIERTNAASGDPDGATTETIRIPVKEERIDIVKTPVDLEEVSVSTRPVEELQEAKAIVRREELRVESLGQTGDSSDPAEEART